MTTSCQSKYSAEQAKHLFTTRFFACEQYVAIKHTESKVQMAQRAHKAAVEDVIYVSLELNCANLKCDLPMESLYHDHFLLIKIECTALLYPFPSLLQTSSATQTPAMASYHFCRSIDKSLVSSLSKTDQLEDTVFAALIELVFGFLTTSQQVRSLSCRWPCGFLTTRHCLQTDAMLSEVEAFRNSHKLSQEQANSCIRAWLTFFRLVQRGSLTPKQLFEDLMTLGLDFALCYLILAAF